MKALDLSTYLVTDTAACGGRDVFDVLAAALRGGVTAVQVREKNASTRELYELVLRAAEVVAGRATLLVDDRVDVVLAARATGARVDGVHVGQGDLPADVVRSLLGPDAVVGLSANTPEHLARVAALPAGTVDYLGVGPIRPTSTKPDHPAPLGVAGFAAIVAATALPCVAIGSVRADDAPALREAGTAGLAVVSAICSAPDPQRAARDLATAWARAGAALGGAGVEQAA